MPAADAPALVWFRDDLRLSDQPALHAAAASGRPLICLYVFDAGRSEGRALGAAVRWWLHHSLGAHAAALEKIGGRLDIVEANHADLPAIAQALGAGAVYWTRRYGAEAIETDKAVKAALLEAGLEANSYCGQLLREPWEVTTQAGQPMRVFTPFWRAHQALGDTGAPLPAPRKITAADWPRKAPKRAKIEDLALLPTKPDWAGGMRDEWTPGEAGAKARLKAFFKSGLEVYAQERDLPAKPSTSRLSPHLRFGEISPRSVLHATRHLEAENPKLAKGATKFLSEIGWREFAFHLLYHNPQLATRNHQPRFDHFPWRKPDAATLKAWRLGRTGYPIVDAGMRELWRTGYMHNRVRMIVASFLVKHLLVDWRVGEEWFWDTLCDADPANNPASWQWVAGSGADAAPYFRIFNPMVQGERFDPEGDYVRAHVPELARVPKKFIHTPWLAPAEILAAAGVKLGATYPAPIVEHAAARDRALAAFSTLA
jgi:deoxyribodipyrimidine photo-lyase